MKLKELISYLESIAPLSLQESYDNSGLQVMPEHADPSSILVTLDCTEEVVEEAIQKKCGLIVAHHPVIFGGLKRLTGATYPERTVMKALRAGVGIYAIHTNLDNVLSGVNHAIADRLGLTNRRVLDPRPDTLRKLVTFVPAAHLELVRLAMFDAGAGQIGNYDQCSFGSNGTGTFRGGSDTQPFVGEPGKLHQEAEIRLEVVLPAHLQSAVVSALLKAHPYEEVAWDLYSLENRHPEIGSGMVGELPEPMSGENFLRYLKERIDLKMIRHTKMLSDEVKRVALCGGAGSFLLKKAIAAGADAYVSADFKYHEFFDAENRILIADVGHFESEKFTKNLLRDMIVKKFPNIAVLLSETDTNPVNYF